MYLDKVDKIDEIGKMPIADGLTRNKYRFVCCARAVSTISAISAPMSCARGLSRMSNCSSNKSACWLRR
jgi:hypothetical protein